MDRGRAGLRGRVFPGSLKRLCSARVELVYALSQATELTAKKAHQAAGLKISN
jgi:hypothetical protein